MSPTRTNAFSLASSSTSTSASIIWSPVGPGPAATARGSPEGDYGPAIGRVTAIAVDPYDSSGNTVYVGGAYGGLWKSTDAANPFQSPCPNSEAKYPEATCGTGVHWQPLLDDQPTLAVGAIAVHPQNPNWILVGTGEANNAASSYYGLGILLSQDGGQSWQLIDNADGSPLHGLGFTRIAFDTDNPSLVVATAAVANAALDLGAENGGEAARGIYYSNDGGQSWHHATVMDGSTQVTAASANSVLYDPLAKRFYANLRFHGFYSSSDGANWTRLASQPGGSLLSASSCPASPASPSCPLFRAEMAAVPVRNDRFEMYVWIVDANDASRGIFQTLDGGNSWAQVSTASMDNCGDSQGCGAAEGTYNLALAAVPDGSLTDLYAGALNIFKCRFDPTNPAGCTFANLTHALGCTPIGSYAHVHPSQHAIAFSPAHPEVMYFGNDGGVYRALNSFAPNSGSCDSPPSLPWFDNLDANFGSMLQFVSIAQHPADEDTLLGGTEDNGSPFTSAATASSGTWLAANRGDGGFAAINPSQGDEWFTSVPGSNGSGLAVNVQRCTLGTDCTSASFSTVVDAARTGGDASSFHPPFLLDPQATDRLLVGTCRVWRGNSDGTGAEWGTPGSPLSINFDADPPGSSSSTACSVAHTKVASIAAGGSVTSSGSQVLYAGLEGDTLAATGGELWVTTSADLGPASWKRALSANSACSGGAFNPRHYSVSDIALDPADPTGRTAFVTVMGFTGGQSGHVFKVNVGDSTSPTFATSCSDVTGNLPDTPADSLAIEPTVPATVYVGTDVGVFTASDPSPGAVWTELGPATGANALPNVPVMRLRLFSNAGSDVRLRAATFGRGVWEAVLTPDFRMTLEATTVSTFTGVQTQFAGTLTALAGYSSAVTITCESTEGNLPNTCAAAGSITPTPSGAAFEVKVGNSAVQNFSFNLKAMGADGTVHTIAVTLHVGDFSMTSPNPSTLDAPHGQNVSTNVTLIPSGSVDALINLSCTGQGGSPLPAGLSCTPAPASTSLSSGSVDVSIAVLASDSVPQGPYNLEVTAASSDGARSRSVALMVTVEFNPRFELRATGTPLGAAKPGKPLSTTFSVASLDGYGPTTLDLSCGMGSNSGAATCAVTPSSVSLSAGGMQTGSVTVNTTGAVAANTTVTVTGTDGTITSSLVLAYSVQDFHISPANLALLPGGSGSATVSFASDNGYSGTVAASCDSTAGFSGNPCALAPATPITLTAGTNQLLTLTVSAPLNTAAGQHTVRLRGTDIDFPALAHEADASVTVYDFRLSAAVASATVKAGQAASFDLNMSTGPQAFPQPVTLSCSGLPQFASCQFSPATVAAGSSGATIHLTLTTTANTVAAIPRGQRSLPIYAFTLALGGVFLGIGVRSRRRWLTACVLLIAVGFTRCGGSAGHSDTPPIPQPGTPSGSYTVTIQGTSIGSLGTAQRSTQVTLVIQ